MIFFYRFLTFLLFPLFILILYIRSFTGKEDRLRFTEKISVKEDSLQDHKKVFWIHAASIGETNSVLPLIKEIMECADNGKPYALQNEEGKELFSEIVKNIFKELNHY